MASAMTGNAENRFASKLCAIKKAGNISSVRMLVKLFELQTMSEGRKMKILLLDGRKLDMLIKPKLLAGELLDMVASHFSLKEKEYFGLQFKDSLGKNHWLQHDRQVLDHSFPKTTAGNVIISFGVRFYVESMARLKDDSTVELFYLQARQSIYEGKIECENDSVFMLAAYALQATYGDFTDDKAAKDNLKTLCVLPTETLKAFPSLPYCEDRILTVYQNLKGHTHASSIRSYMSIVERLPMYGVHYTEVKDRSGLPWWLGVSFRGISIYDFNDRKIPRRVFAWNQLENIYFRDRKFSVEIHDARRSSSIPRRLFNLSSVNVLSWTTETAQLTKTLWTMAIAQHQFCMDSKKSTVSSDRSSRGIFADFPNVSSKVNLRSRKSIRGHHARSWSASFTLSDGNFVPLISAKVVERELVEALKARKAALEEELDEKKKSLTNLCLQEAAITGHLPEDVPPEVIDLEKASQNVAFVPGQPTVELVDEIESCLKKLEKDFQLQKRVSSAYENLVNCVVVDQQIHKSRQQLHLRALEKLKHIETKLKHCQMLAGKSEHCHHDSTTRSSVGRSSRDQRMSAASCSSPNLLTISSDRGRSSRPLTEAAALGAWTCVESHGKDILTKRHSVVDPMTSSDCVLPGNPFSECHVLDSVTDMALYNLKTHQMANYLSTEELDVFPQVPGGRLDRFAHRWPSKHASLEGAYRRGGCGGTGVSRMARNLSSGCLECQELYSERGGPILDRSSLSSILDMTCEDEAAVNDAFEPSAATEGLQIPLLVNKQCCCETEQRRCYVQQRCCISDGRAASCSICSRKNITVPLQSQSVISRRSNSCSENRRQVWRTRGKLPSHDDSSASNSDKVVTSHQSRSAKVDTGGGCENCLCAKPSIRNGGEVSRSSSCSHGRMTKKSTTKVSPGTECCNGFSRRTPHRVRSHSLHSQKLGQTEITHPHSSREVFS